ncbi:hypothetical protein CEXT_77131 [Caerostris extrusa]|uniref:Uncharacterized protein n=1 Tax=Caerostris extrusa TaxID=172846 RepID=A0AAV4MTM3_CAEEX|nr:hypothetical protein CEXT_77131 [Caerostris extrusa]
MVYDEGSFADQNCEIVRLDCSSKEIKLTSICSGMDTVWLTINKPFKLSAKRNGTKGNLLSTSERATVLQYRRTFRRQGSSLPHPHPESYCTVDFASGPIRHPQRCTLLMGVWEPGGIYKLPYYLVIIVMNAEPLVLGFF